MKFASAALIAMVVSTAAMFAFPQEEAPDSAFDAIGIAALQEWLNKAENTIERVDDLEFDFAAFLDNYEKHVQYVNALEERVMELEQKLQDQGFRIFDVESVVDGIKNAFGGGQ